MRGLFFLFSTSFVTVRDGSGAASNSSGATNTFSLSSSASSTPEGGWEAEMVTDWPEEEPGRSLFSSTGVPEETLTVKELRRSQMRDLMTGETAEGVLLFMLLLELINLRIWTAFGDCSRVSSSSRLVKADNWTLKELLTTSANMSFSLQAAGPKTRRI